MVNLGLYMKNLAEQARIANPVDTTEIRKAVMEGKTMKVLPFAEWMKFSREEIRMLLHETATYVVPTQELIKYLDELIGTDFAIEIGAGNGYMGSNLDIIMTDSMQQRYDKMCVAYYKAMGQPLIDYPRSVIRMEGVMAAKYYKPHTVLACYATHKWREDTQDGNDKGIDFIKLLSLVKRIILVGNKITHRNNPLMDIPHQEIKLPGLLTRAMDDATNRIFIWEN